jgi:hypothetical protein
MKHISLMHVTTSEAGAVRQAPSISFTLGMLLQVGVTWGAPVELLAGPRGFDLPGPVREVLELCNPANEAQRGTMDQLAELSFCKHDFSDVHMWPPVRRTVREPGLVVELLPSA